MSDPGPSLTAQRVAAHRLSFDRLQVPYGDPAADDRLARDIAGPLERPPRESMERYLRGRTAFFDRAAVDALESGTGQAVVIGAGYDGRALRYAKPGVRWWEVDLAKTQLDKRARLARLGVATPNITFVPHDLRDGNLGACLVTAGFDPLSAAIFICEGVAVYLSRNVLGALLREVRGVAAPGARLAISLSTSPRPGVLGALEHAARRERFERRAARVGEPALTRFGPGEAAQLLAATGWEELPVREKAQLAGFVIAVPAGGP